jgi:hypothetical protein
MLILPSRLHHQPKQPCLNTSTSTIHTSQDPQPTSKPQDQNPDTMISVMPPARPVTSNRPKLSLQTSHPPPNRSKPALNLSFTIDSPTIRNTHVNAFEFPPPQNSPFSRGTEAASPQHQPTLSSNPSGTSSTSSHTSPFAIATPYFLPLGARSILRNSPLPRRHVSATSARTPRKMFPPVKRVIFHEPLEEIIPTAKLEEPSDSSDSDGSDKRQRTEDEIKERRAIIEEEDGSATPVHGRRKRRREWVWRPLDDDILTSHHKDESDVAPPSCLERAGSSNGESQ